MPKIKLSYGSETDQLFRNMNVLMGQYDNAGENWYYVPFKDGQV